MAVEDRRFAELETSEFNQRNTDPVVCNDEEGRRAVKIAHAADLERISDYLKRGQSVLVECDKTLVNYLLELLSDDGQLSPGKRLLPAIELQHVAFNLGPPRPPDSVLYHLTSQMAERFRDARSRPNHVVVVRHLELMTWNINEQPRQELNDILYWLAEYPGVVKLVFWDPLFSVPRVVSAAFPNRVVVRSFERDVLWRLLSSEEAHKISGQPGRLTISAQSTFYQHVAGVNVVELRRILRSLADSPNLIGGATNLEPVYQFIRAETGAAPMVQPGAVVGYDHVREQLRREVVFPVGLRRGARTDVELRRADALAPRGVLLVGPPGTGKSEWAKWLAHELNTPLFIIHGPELKSRWVGETEAAIRRVVSAARRAAPAVILIDEIDSMTPSRGGDASNFERSMVDQLLTEMDGLRREESVIFVGTTNVPDALDVAFLRPGRFGTVIHIGYPAKNDSRLILEHYSSVFLLDLSSDELDRMASLTDGKFTGDHLRAICQCLSRERLYRDSEIDKRLPPFKVEDAVEAVRRQPFGPQGASTAGTWSWHR